MPEPDSIQPSTERRRSERVSDSLPIIVRGIDLLGQPFEERTSTLAFNLHGCRYASKHHLPKNTWVSLEIPEGSDRHNVRARVAWIQRPHSVREFFQIAVELEGPANLWGVDVTPAGWTMAAPLDSASAGASFVKELQAAQESEAAALPTTFATFMDKLMSDMTSATPGFFQAEPDAAVDSTQVTSSPLLRELRAELGRQATKAAQEAASQAQEKISRAAEEMEQKQATAAEEFLRGWKEEFERVQSASREQFSAQLAERHGEFQSVLKSDFERNFGQARQLMEELEQRAHSLREENEAAQEATSRMAQTRLQMEANEAAHATKQSAEASKNENDVAEYATDWRQRLESEMTLAQSQWNELLQSSLDSGMQRLVGQLSERTQEALRTTDQKMAERFAELRQPFAQASSEARETFSEIRTALEKQMGEARSSLAEIENAASRIKETSAQFEAASHDALNELHRRLEKILDAQTAEMNRRAESLATAAAQRVTPTLDSLANQFVERSVAEVESKLAPHLKRVPELLRELSAREVQVEESLRLHRERLRQVSENNQRDVGSQIAATLIDLRNDFEAARKEALAKWNEELESSGVRAAHAAGESISRSSEWFQQEARARLQVLVEQSLATAGSGLEDKTADATRKFEAQLEGESSARVAKIGEQLERVAGELAGRTRTQFGEAAEAAAATFGQVLREVSEEEVAHFTYSSRTALQERTQDLERSAQLLLNNLEANAGSSLERFQTQMSSQLEAVMAEGRSALTAEFASILEGYRAERAEHQKEWLASLDRQSGEAVEKYQERLETTCDSWMISSVRRLNEHGQNVIESLMRSSDQALRDSFSKVFDGLAEMLRDRTKNAAGVAGFAQAQNRETQETSSPRNETVSNQ